jgi:uncharacterized Zn finger protein (UPF0148 family)
VSGDERGLDMSDILSQLMTPELKFAFTLVIIVIALLYILSIIWTVRDSYLRGTNPQIWGLIALIPFLGCMVYAMMRPPLYASDREEQNIGLLLQQRELMAYGECPKCGYPTERDYVLCPNCHTRLKNQCSNCMHTLEPEWAVCPYCATKVVRERRPTDQRKAASRAIPSEFPTGQAPTNGLPRRSHDSAASANQASEASRSRAAASTRRPSEATHATGVSSSSPSSATTQGTASPTARHSAAFDERSLS